VDFTHNVFGLVLRSNLAIPGLPPLEAPSGIPDVHIHLGVSPSSESRRPGKPPPVTYTSSYMDEGGKPIWEIRASPHGSLFHLTYYDGMQFWLDRRGKALWAVWPSQTTLEDACSYLLGPVLGMLLRLREVTCLHASAVAFGDYSVAFVGWAGAGKSTTAAAFARQGSRILSDDIVALAEKEAGFHVLPAYPHLCLWPDSVKVLYGSPEALPRFVPDWEKRRLALGGQGARFEDRPLLLGAIYVLGDRRPEPAPYVEKIGASDALVSLVTNTYANKILDRELRAREFAVLGRLVSSVPMRRVYPHADATRLEELCKVIQEDLAAIDFPATAQPRE